jgi:hypothetical protein
MLSILTEAHLFASGERPGAQNLEDLRLSSAAHILRISLVYVMHISFIINILMVDKVGKKLLVQQRLGVG